MHWLYHYWFTYEWPSLQGNGPEDVTSSLTKIALAMALIPVIRKFIKREVAKAHAELNVVEAEVEKVARDLLKPARWVLTQLKKVARVRVRVTTKPRDVHDAVAHDPTSVPFPPAVPGDGTVAP